MRTYTVKISNIILAAIVFVLVLVGYITFNSSEDIVYFEVDGDEPWYGQTEETVIENTAPLYETQTLYEDNVQNTTSSVNTSLGQYSNTGLNQYDANLESEDLLLVSTTHDNVEDTTLPLTTNSPINIAQRFQDRFDRLRHFCPITSKDDLRRKVWIFNDNFVVDLEKRLLVCAVPKAGSSNWHMLIWKMRRQREGLSTDAKLYSYNDTLENIKLARGVRGTEGKQLVLFQEGIDDKINAIDFNPTSHRVISVRHPFSRLISGWNQKFHRDSQYWKDLYVRYPLLNQFKDEGDETHEMSFPNLANFVAKYGADARELDYHFKPASGVCKPCGYVYSYIVKSETFDDDVDWIRHKLNLDELTLGRHGVGPPTSEVTKNSKETIRHYMGMLSTTVVKQLMDVYKQDFELFGYTFDAYTLDAGGFQ